MDVKKPKKHKLTEEELKALLGKTCPGRQWFLMKKAADYNKLALFLKINGVNKIELGKKAYTYEVDLRDETIAGAFILTEKAVGSVRSDGKKIGDDAVGAGASEDPGTRWYIAAAVVAPDYRGHDIGRIMLDKMKKLAGAEGANAVYVDVTEDTPSPDDIDGVTDAASFWESLGFVDWGDGLLVLSLD
ncbi:MAG: GNAT family N-acetyltransferase [Eubacterium sp.]|nr:GNAT family N-acetyltransferase [Eubacterium sp.]